MTEQRSMTFPRKLYRFELSWPIGETGHWSALRREAFDRVYGTANEVTERIRDDGRLRKSAGVTNPKYRIIECSESVIEEGRS